MRFPAARVFLVTTSAWGTIATAGACSLTSLSDLSSGGAASAGDANVATDSSPDVTDSDVTDGGGRSDPLVDAPPGAPFCSTISPSPVFCDEFERTDPKGSWGTVDLVGGMLTTAPSTRGSGRELVATLPLLAGGGVQNARLVRIFPVAKTFTVSYALRIDSAPSEGAQQLMTLSVQFPATSDFYATYLFLRPGGINLVEQTFPGGKSDAFIEHPLARPIPFATWTRIDMVVELSAPPRLRLSIGGQVAFDGAADPFLRPGVPVLSAGIHYTTAPSGPLSVRVDDLYVDLK